MPPVGMSRRFPSSGFRPEARLGRDPPVHDLPDPKPFQVFLIGSQAAIIKPAVLMPGGPVWLKLVAETGYLKKECGWN
jgi:hypothetical protein